MVKSIRKIIFMINILFMVAVLITATLFFFFKIDFSITGEGVIEPYDQILIKSPLDGIIDEVYVEDGETVEEDELMFRISGVDVEINNATIVEEYNLKREIYLNLKSLYEKEIVSKREFLEAENEYKKAEINKKKIEKTLILSPMSGFIVSDKEMRLKKGDYIKKGDLLTKISQLDKFIVRLDVLENEIYKIKTGQKASVQIKGFSKYKAILNGYVIKILPEGRVENNKKLFEVVVLLTEQIGLDEYNRFSKIFPMMSAKVRIVYSEMTFFKYLLKETFVDEDN